MEMTSIEARLAALALLAGVVTGCGMPPDSGLAAQQVSTGDPEVIARRVLDLEAMRLEGKDAVAISQDLSFAVFRRREAGTAFLAMEDLETGQVRDLTGPYEDIYPSYYPFAVAPGGEWVVANSQRIGSQDIEHKLIRLDGRSERVLTSFSFDRLDHPIDYVEALGWSNDGTKVISQVWMRDGSTRLEIFSRDDGRSVVLKAFDWRAPGWAAFSPDGRYVAYDFQTVEESPSSDLYVLSIDGSGEHRLTNDSGAKTLIGWSPDGRAIYYAVSDSDAASASVWRIPMRGDRPTGPATLVKRDIAGSPWFVLKGDRILYRIGSPATPPLWAATVDPANDRVVSPPSSFLELEGRIVAGARFDWTPDGEAFTYVRSATRGGRSTAEIVLRPSSGNGDERTIALDGIGYLTGRMPYGEDAILIRGATSERPGYGELRRVDLTSGTVTTIVEPKFDVLREGDFPVYRGFSHDLSVLYMARERDDATEVVARNMDSGTERTLHRVDTRMTHGQPRVAGPALSPDGRLLAFLTFSGDATPNARPGDSGSNQLHVISVDGGPSRVVHEGWIGGASLNWTSDSRSLVFRDAVTPGAPGGQVWKVAVDGSASTLLFSMPSGLGGIRLSPDDRRVVFSGPVERRVEELWVLENLPETRAAATSANSR
jgi:Tol biopolymer transport system component